MATTVNLGLTTLQSNQSNPEVTINNNYAIIDGIMHLAIISTSLTTPPAANDGDIYIPATGATGAWNGYANYIAYYNQGWFFVAPTQGWLAYNLATTSIIVFNGSAWVQASSATTFVAETFRIAKQADSTAKLYFDISNIPTSTSYYIKMPADNYILTKQNLSATTAPTAANDSSQGYAVDSRWIDITNDKVYICVDATISGAIWKEIASATGSGDIVGPGSSIDNEIIRFSGVTGQAAEGTNVFISDNNELYGNFLKVDSKVTNYTLTAADSGKTIIVNSSSALVITLPQTSTETIAQGFYCDILRRGSGIVTVQTEGSDVLESKSVATTVYPQYGLARIIKIVNSTPNIWSFSGDIN